MVKQYIYFLAISGILLSPFSSHATDKEDKNFLQRLGEKARRPSLRKPASPQSKEEKAPQIPAKKSSSPLINFGKQEKPTSINLQKPSQNSKGKPEDMKDRCPAILNYHQLEKILSAEFDPKRSSTKATYIDQETQISIKTNSSQSLKSYLQKIKDEGEKVEAKFSELIQSSYRGGTIMAEGEDCFEGCLAKYALMKEGKAVTFGKEIVLTLSVSKKKEYRQKSKS